MKKTYFQTRMFIFCARSSLRLYGELNYLVESHAFLKHFQCTMKRFLILSALQPILMELATGGMGKHKANEGKGARRRHGIG